MNQENTQAQETPAPRKKGGCLVRLIVWPIVLLLVIVAIAVGVVVHKINDIAETVIERAGTQALGVETTVDDVNIAVLLGEAEVYALKIANPEGFKDAQFLTMKKADAAVNLPSLRGEQIDVPYIHISDVAIYLEKTMHGANYKVLMDNVGKATGGSEAPDDTAQGKRYIIRELTIENITATVTAPIIGTTPITIDRIALHDVGSDNAGVKMKELMGLVVRSILAAVAKRGAGLLPADLLNDLQIANIDVEQLQKLGFELIGSAGEEASGLTEGLSEMGKTLTDDNLSAEEKAGKIAETIGQQTGDTAERAKETADKLKEGLGGMFKKKDDE